jgi:hypothetical protein
MLRKSADAHFVTRLGYSAVPPRQLKFGGGTLTGIGGDSPHAGFLIPFQVREPEYPHIAYGAVP